MIPVYEYIDGVPCHVGRTLLTAILREKRGFGVLVVADYVGAKLLYTHHGIAEGAATAAAQSFNAGIDVELPGHECALHLKEPGAW
ncbi:glycoside hydrolase family 3 N-terminal domain-containing protein [Paraburkholderia youngii]|uniref:glycoside hydrolase family 3 N-terminal domain-containing protein n=1 Tax=Paraburkholderia youngii TaxID=2782701 RepID=UPI003D23C9CA